MSTIVGHGLAAAAVYGAVRRPARLPGGRPGYGLAVALGVAPDMDVLVRIAFDAGNHRGPSHSIAAALALAAVAALLVCARRWRDIPRAWAGFSLVCLVHPVLDWAMACGPGVPFLWPWTAEGWLCPVQFVPTAYYSNSMGGLLGLFNHTPTMRAVGMEALIFGPWLALGLMWTRLKNTRLKLFAAILCLAVSSAGLAVTWVIYN